MLTGQGIKSFCVLPVDTEDFEVKRNQLQQETVREGKLRANPLHLPEEETK